MGVFKNSITSQLLFQEVVLKCRILGHADGTASLPIYRNERRYFDSDYRFSRAVSIMTVIVVIFGLMIITLIIVCVRGACCCKYLRGGSGGRMPGYLGP